MEPQSFLFVLLAAVYVIAGGTETLHRDEDAMRRAAHDDPLPRLANRRALMDRLGRSLADGNRRSGCIAVVYLDLDEFKAINDRFGHDGGDAILKQVADRLRSATRAGDCVGRIGGDEFMIVSTIGDSTDVESLADRIDECFSAPFDFRDTPIDVRASIGWATAEGPAGSPEQLVTDADRVMYEHKHGRAAGVRTPDPEPIS